MQTEKPIIIAHRGAKGMAPENTLGAFRLGVEQGCEAIELDVHLSADGEIIVCHDETLDRTTNGKGMICEKTLAEIKSLDAGSWHSEAYRGETVPTLGEVFDAVPGSLMINVEVKQSYDGNMDRKLVQFLRERDLFDRVVVSSFDHQCLHRIKVLEPKTKIGLLYQLRLYNPAAYAKTFGVDVYSLHPYHRLIDREEVEQAIRAGLHMYPYTANEEQDLKALIDWGVSGIITDYPGRLKDLLALGGV
ncbi:glycerophosphodiester phosphodiesterase [Paenibacillus doosanensis]|uniref:Glycerophosphoryl diester phosphodiesterase n=1 Tax=Paenibacillus konkukensis TaxID=2020716 RepID=A0ABY4RT41_9BACL|nr:MULTISPECIES: glycerophosphodiester phosphodiesterase [Paenibacillus]MCS7463877.1 glycerophosphodiester phosphodiesterase [Paenibacillus doosanensis]UQZ85741.1 Glycerophosphoryl diester phosphodiesterase [Paenibacillus konkukensis]